MVKRISFFILFCFKVITAQDFFPMHVGDWWSFYNYSTEQVSQYTIVDTQIVDDMKYYQFEGYPRFIGLFRKDSLNNLLRFSHLDSTCCDTVFKLNAAIGDTWISIDQDPPLVGTYLGLDNFGNKHFHFYMSNLYEDDLYLKDNWGLKYLMAEGNSFVCTGAYIDGEYLSIDSQITAIPQEYYSIYPNPFNDYCQIQITESIINGYLEIYNLKGQKIRSFQVSNSLIWNGTDKFGKSVPSGIYYARLISNHSVYRKKITLLK